ncbi:chemotaxis protein CheX [Desulfurispira natronophila]|uniref:Chemotaxis protein CheX n=1 Tax=Desulfurispira natronophila TaxID=682562 RepID=A0A7W7Y2C4_9BACT|nr:chemotaxis protein CheX [Desulfurispira natronophila]MBB5020788.1 chemotaxis protein CheX [Desulfurispira natronophila]
MKANFINPFVLSTINVLASIIDTPLGREQLFLKEESNPTFDISAVIGIAGDVHGSVVLSFPREVALKLVSAFIGEEKTSIDDDVKDAVGELVNIISGGAKKELSASGVRFKISIPHVVVGHDHCIKRPKNVPCIVLPFIIQDIGKFVVEVSMRELIPT